MIIKEYTGFLDGQKKANKEQDKKSIKKQKAKTPEKKSDKK